MSLYWQATLPEACVSEPESTVQGVPALAKITELTYQRLKMLRSQPGAVATGSRALTFAAVLYS